MFHVKHYGVLPLLLVLALVLSLSPALATEPDQIVLLTQDGTRIEGTPNAAVTIRYGMYDIDTSLFSWGGYRHGEYGYLSINLSDDQVDWAKSQEGPATLEINGQVFAGTVTCWIPTHWVLSFHPEGGDDSPAGHAIHDAFYAPLQDDDPTTPSLNTPVTFSDVPADAWYAPYVDVCVEAGLMQGVGEGRFAPEKTLSWQECAMLALRLHHMGQGGDGVFDPAPAEWNYYTLRTQADDLLVSQGYLDSDGQGMDLHWIPLGSHITSGLGFDLETEDDKAWGQEMDRQSVTLTVNGVVYSGTFKLYDQHLFFSLSEDEYKDEYGYYYDIPLDDPMALWVGETWYRDGWYYAQQNELGQGRLIFSSDARWAFASRMAEVTDLPAINDISANAIPDLESQLGPADTLELYRAGVLTGVDGQGTFAPWSTMTRAEAAAICARILKPELRVRFTLPALQEP